MASGSPFSSFLVSPKELSELLSRSADGHNESDQRVVPVCGAWYLPNAGRTGIDSFREKRIPNARFFDIDAIADNTRLPHLLPSATDFAAGLSQLGIRPSDVLVVYDTYDQSNFSAPRVAWTLQVFGHKHVHILDNFKTYVDGGYPIESGEPSSVSASAYAVPTRDDSKVIAFEELRDHFLNPKEDDGDRWQILDPRPHRFWSGEIKSRPDAPPSGHLPDSINVPLLDLLDPDTRTFLPAPQLRADFEAKGVDPERPIVTSCGSGITAAALEIALQQASYGQPQLRRLYDGSWREWSQRAAPYDGLIVQGEK